MITSLANERIKHIRRLRERKYRRETGLFFVEGLRLVGEAMETGAVVHELIYSPELLQSDFGKELVELAQKTSVGLLEVSEGVFESISNKEGPQGLAAVMQQTWAPLETVVIERGKPWVALDSVADPGNLGTILRTNDASGGAGVILLEQSTDPYDPTAVRASMGAIFSQKVCQADVDQFLTWKNQHDFVLIGTSDAARLDYHVFGYPERFVLLMGSERAGMQPRLSAACDEVVSIPMLGKSDSLNLAVATAVILYEALNQRRDRP